VPAMVVLELVLLSLGHVFALTIPMAVLVATMLAFSQMVAENEIMAMRSGGISLYRIIAGPLVASVLMTVFMFCFNNYLLPETNHRLKNLMVAVRSKKPALDFKTGRFIETLPGYTLFIGKKDEVSGDLFDLLIFKEERGKQPSFISATKASFDRDTEQDLLRMKLRDGERFEAELSKREELKVTVFDRMDILLPDINSDLQRREHQHRSDREMSVAMMRKKVAGNSAEIERLDARLGTESEKQLENLLALLDPAELESYQADKVPGFARGKSRAARRAAANKSRAAPRIETEENTLTVLNNLVLSRRSMERRSLRYQVEVHKKFSIPFACLVFILMGAPIAIKTGRSGTGWGISFSLLLFTIYYVFLVSGEELADRQILSPWIAMWAANILLLCFGVWMLIWTNRESRPFSLMARIADWREIRRAGRQ
jgi:lipopolysaccharide export system permease protein